MKKKHSGEEQCIITIAPIGLDEGDVLQVLSEGLKRVFGCRIRTARRLEIPSDSYSAPRNQYLAPLFLQALRNSRDPEKEEKILGVTDKDLYVEGLNFVFGQAELGGSFAVISLTRLHQSFYDLREDRMLFLKRASKEAVHELGHTFGLKHCPNSFCVMCFSNSLRDTDRKNVDFCQPCRTIIDQE